MDVVIDACSVINLTNVGALEHALSLTKCRLAVGPLVLTECHGDAAAQVAAAQVDGLLDFVNDDDFPADLYLQLLDEHELGEGETECIAIAQLEGLTVCCDDRRARRIARELLGEERVVGSLRLLKWCVEEEVITCEKAHEYALQMRAAGGFVPAMGHEFFCD
jgi:predicted nucleic acid-binding protein